MIMNLIHSSYLKITLFNESFVAQLFMWVLYSYFMLQQVSVQIEKNDSMDAILCFVLILWHIYYAAYDITDFLTELPLGEYHGA